MVGIESRRTRKGAVRHRAVIFDRRTGRKVYSPWGPTVAAARSWRRAALAEIERGERSPASSVTLRVFAKDWLAGARAGTVLDRRGSRFRPATLRGYERGLARVLDELGAHRLVDVRRADVQALVDRLVGQGFAPGSVRNTLVPLRSIYRHALRRDLVAVNPTTELAMPQPRDGRRVDIDPARAADLLEALPKAERALWATALYAGLRRGELRALRWSEVDLDTGLIHVRRSWDDVHGEGEPKTRAAIRRVPIIAPLAALLSEARSSLRAERVMLRAERGSEASDLVFGMDGKPITSGSPSEERDEAGAPAA